MPRTDWSNEKPVSSCWTACSGCGWDSAICASCGVMVGLVGSGGGLLGDPRASLAIPVLILSSTFLDASGKTRPHLKSLLAVRARKYVPNSQQHFGYKTIRRQPRRQQSGQGSRLRPEMNKHFGIRIGTEQIVEEGYNDLQASAVDTPVRLLRGTGKLLVQNIPLIIRCGPGMRKHNPGGTIIDVPLHQESRRQALGELTANIKTLNLDRETGSKHGG